MTVSNWHVFKILIATTMIVRLLPIIGFGVLSLYLSNYVLIIIGIMANALLTYLGDKWRKQYKQEIDKI